MDTALKAECLALVPPKGRSSLFPLCEHQHYSYVIPSEVEGPPKCGTRHPSRRGPSTALRMTTLGRLSFLCESNRDKHVLECHYRRIGQRVLRPVLYAGVSGVIRSTWPSIDSPLK